MLKAHELDQRFYVPANPVKDLAKSKFTPLYGAADERVSLSAFDINVEAVAPKEDIGGGECDAFIASDEAEAVVVAERFHQGGCFFFDGIVIPGLRTKNSGLNRAFIADTMYTAKQLDQSMLHPVDFRYRKIIRHLLCEAL
jgi:hypothetical protein